MRLIDADALHESILTAEMGKVYKFCFPCKEMQQAIDEQPTIVEFEGDINKVIVKGEEYHKQLTTTWLNPYSPYTCEKCGFHVDSKTRFCPECGRKATNYD